MKYTSAIAATGSGSIGGATASHNRGGQYFRRRAIPVNPSTPDQEEVRGLFSQLQGAWGGDLTQAQRDGWDTYALNTLLPGPLGNLINVGGKGMYTRGNVPRLQAGLARIDAAPGVYGIPSFPVPGAITLTAATGILAYTYGTGADWQTLGGAILVYGSRPVSLAVNGFKGPFRFAGSTLGTVASPGSETWPFALAAGQKAFVRFQTVDSIGRLSGQYILPLIAA